MNNHNETKKSFLLDNCDIPSKLNEGIFNNYNLKGRYLRNE